MPGPKTPKSPSEGGLVQIGGAPSIQEARPDSQTPLGLSARALPPVQSALSAGCHPLRPHRASGARWLGVAR